MKAKAFLGVSCGLLAVLVGTAWVRGVGQPPAAGTDGAPAAAAKDGDRPADRAAVREATGRFARAFEKGDAAAVAAQFTETGEYDNDDGPPIRGRAALAKAYADFFAKRAEQKLASASNAIRFVGQDAAVEEGTFTAKAKDQPTRTCRYSALLV